jgi:hypothetical protein
VHTRRKKSAVKEELDLVCFAGASVDIKQILLFVCRLKKSRREGEGWWVRKKKKKSERNGENMNYLFAFFPLPLVETFSESRFNTML